MAKNQFNDTFPVKQVPEDFMANLRKQYGEAASIVPAKYPADPTAKTAGGSELRTNYKGYVVAVSPDYVAQRVDNGGTKTNIVLHDRAAVSVPPSRGGEAPPIAAKYAEGKINAFDVSITYGADGKGQLYARDRKMDDIQYAANTLKKHAGLDGAKLATFEKNVNGAVENFREDHYTKLREQAKAFEQRQQRQSHAHNLVGQEQSR
jgi:hypothetical protein